MRHHTVPCAQLTMMQQELSECGELPDWPGNFRCLWSRAFLLRGYSLHFGSRILHPLDKVDELIWWHCYVIRCMDLYRNILFSFLFIPFDSRQTDVYRWGIIGLDNKYVSELNKLIFSATLWLRAIKTSLTAGGLLADIGTRRLCYWRKKRCWDMKEEIQICILVVFN